jgi:uncharacterized protein (TIGR03066 family)
MKKILGILTIVVLVAAVILAGCTETSTKKQTDEEKIVGLWKAIQSYNNTAFMSVYNLTTDKTYTVTTTYKGQTNTVNGTWKIENNKFVVTAGNATTALDYLFSDSGNAFAIIDNGIVVNLIRQ